MARTIDYEALVRPVSSAEVAAYKAAEKAKPGYSSAATVMQVIVLVMVLALLGVMTLGLIGLFVTAVSSATRGTSPLGLFGLIVPLGFVALFAFLVFLLSKALLGSPARWEGWYRLDSFARDNGLLFSRSDPNPSYPGAIFGQGDDRTAFDHLRSASDRFLDYGNYRYTIGSGKNRVTRYWGFLALQLDRALPNMLLDSKANNGLLGGTNLPGFAKDQVLSLEGDFDKYFTLYCPKEYERDALYVFTPDLMALLIDEAAPFDVEIIDQWMFVYSNTRFDMRQPALHQRLFRIIDTVGAKTLHQTDRYTDERVQDFAANVVAPQGRRLKRGVSVVAIIVAVVVVAMWVLPWIIGIGAGFSR